MSSKGRRSKMSTNSISVISLANFLSSIILFLSLQFVLYLYFDSIQYIFNLASIDLLQLLSSVSPILVFGCVFGLYEALSYGLLCSVIKNKFYFGVSIKIYILIYIYHFKYLHYNPRLLSVNIIACSCRPVIPNL